jgi:hypothetical protein
MATPPPPSTNIADAIAHQAPSPKASISNDAGHGKTHDWKAGSDSGEEKAPYTTTTVVEATPLPESQPKSRRKNYVRSMRDFFSMGTILQIGAVLVKFGQFTGPGSIISVAYVDPDNFQTAITSGADFEYKLLFMILVSNLIAIYLQVSAILTRESCRVVFWE